VEKDDLGTGVCPKDFETAAVKHGRHFARYLHASKYAAGKRILDAACGSGFGSAYMAEVADSVLGLDLDDGLIELAREQYSLPNLRFEVHDLNQPVTGAGFFDLITSFETLEHVSRASRCLANLADVLTDGGTLLVSVPNGTKELREGNKKPYHKVHFSAPGFKDLLDGQFSHVEFYSQVYCRNFTHYLRKFIGKGTHHACNYRFAAGLKDEAKTWLALCKKPRR
jgi:2-polyprenyl-3-methyl-5-hydroxy-6-metoxy-1,4-benzoquinol methylase